MSGSEIAQRIGRALAGRSDTTLLDREVQVIDLADATIPLLEALVRDGVVVHESVGGTGAEWRAKTLTTLETDRPWLARLRDAYLRRVAQHGFHRG